MITIIFAPPRTGKTCLMTHLLCEEAFNRERTHSMQQEVKAKNASGFNLTIPMHCVSSNYDVVCRKFGYSPRPSRRINPFRLGFKNEYVSTHFNIPFECIGITEAQKYLNSRMAIYFPDWQSRWYEQHGHDNLDIFLDTQRPNLIDVNIRELASFIEVLELKTRTNEYDKVKSMIWRVREIDNSGLFDKYMASGKQDKSCYRERKITAEYDVFSCYDSQSCKPKFYDGHFGADFDIFEAEPTEESLEGYKKFLEEFDDELPSNFYIKRRAT